jgi:hypothetical protein
MICVICYEEEAIESENCCENCKRAGLEEPPETIEELLKSLE